MSSPEFRYAPSKNIYWDRLKNLPDDLKGLAYTDHDTETHRGSWRHHFRKPIGGHPDPSSIPLHVEIGCNAGHVCLEWAKRNPDALYIGIDWKFKQIYRLAEKMKKFQVNNLLAFRANADRLPYMFEKGEIDYLHMFFPDPWPKKAQKKNRTADREWLLSIAPLLSGKGWFHLKTDHAEYFEFIIENLKSLPETYEILETSWNLHEQNPNARALTIPEVTLFERLFIQDGLPIHSVKVRAISK